MVTTLLKPYSKLHFHIEVVTEMPLTEEEQKAIIYAVRISFSQSCTTGLPPTLKTIKKVLSGPLGGADLAKKILSSKYC